MVAKELNNGELEEVIFNKNLSLILCCFVFNHYFVAFFEISVLKEICISCYLQTKVANKKGPKLCFFNIFN